MYRCIPGLEGIGEKDFYRLVGFQRVGRIVVI